MHLGGATYHEWGATCLLGQKRAVHVGGATWRCRKARKAHGSGAAHGCGEEARADGITWRSQRARSGMRMGHQIHVGARLWGWGDMFHGAARRRATTTSDAIMQRGLRHLLLLRSPPIRPAAPLLVVLSRLVVAFTDMRHATLGVLCLPSSRDRSCADPSCESTQHVELFNPHRPTPAITPRRARVVTNPRAH